VSTSFKDWPVSVSNRSLLEEGSEVFIRFNEGVSILKKIAEVENGNSSTLSLPEKKRFTQLVSSRKPFGLQTTFKGKKTKGPDDIKIYQNGGIGYISKDKFSAGLQYVKKWKIYVGRAAPGTGNRDTYPHKIISTPFIGEPNSICSETYLCIGPLQSRKAAESALSYLSCRLARFLILLHKPSQDTTRKVYTFVPTQDWSKKWTDEALYEKYNLSADEIAFIEKIVRPMDLNNGNDE
jgi:site-specific DNA-methyltransferase (adenine-specific)